ncbi:MAG: S8 family serine peptidase [Eubacterium sp.]|nr:S8 family serine peptidase [Eubacterium sp.]
MKNQKISKFKAVIVLIVLLCSAWLALTVSAETTNGVTLNISTDKTSYSENESISVSVSVANKNTYVLTDISLASTFPTEFQISSGQSSITKAALGINENIQNTYSIYKSSLSNVGNTVYPAVMPIAPSGKNGSDTYASEDVSSGSGIELNNSFIDMSGISADKFVIAFIISITIITGIAMIIRNRKSIKKFLSMFLAVTILIPLCNEFGLIDVSAENDSVTAITSFTYGGKQYTISAVMTYSYNTFGEEPVIDVPEYTIDEEHIEIDPNTNIKYIDNEVIVYFDEGYSLDMVNSVLKYVNGTIVGGSPVVREYRIKMSTEYNLDGFDTLTSDLMNKYSFIKLATYDIVYNMSDVIQGTESMNDPWNGFVNGWDELYPNGDNYWLETIQALSAWKYSDKMKSIKVGVVDTNFDNNGDLNYSNNVTMYANEHDYHGTHVAGIIGAIQNNGKGITGIMPNNKKLYCYDSADKKNKSVGSFTEALNSFDKAVVDGCKIINFSLGSGVKYGNANLSDALISLYHASGTIYHMQTLLMLGYDFVVVQSAGNENVDAYYNGFFSAIPLEDVLTNRVIIVGNVGYGANDELQMAGTSNYGNAVDICAPGLNICSLGYNNKCSVLSGTSMAAPMVTAVCGMVWAANDSLKGSDVKNIVISSYNNTVPDKVKNIDHPVLNAKLSIEKALRISNDEGRSLVKGKIVYNESEFLDVSLEIAYSDSQDYPIKSIEIPNSNYGFELAVTEGVSYNIKVIYNDSEDDYEKNFEVIPEYNKAYDLGIINLTSKEDEDLYIPLNTTITGNVSDSATGKVLPNASIEIYTDKKYFYNNIDGIISIPPIVTEDYEGTLVATAVSDENGNYSVDIEYNSAEVDSIYIKSVVEGYKEFTSEYLDIDSNLEYNIDMNADAVSVFAGGEGTVENPYQVSTPEQLDAVRNDLDANYIQVNDIDLSGFDNWEPIGEGDELGISGGITHPFIGEYNGNGYTISNLTISNSSRRHVGLFGYASEASLSNIALTNVNINIDLISKDYTIGWGSQRNELKLGSVAGTCNDVSNCYVSGIISIMNSHNAYIGGVIGVGISKNCKNYCDISIVSNRDGRHENDSVVYVGGILGHSSAVHSEVTNCINYGSVTATGGYFVYCGGISGLYGDISYCINCGNIKGTNTNGSGVTNSFALNCNVGGIVGASSGDTKICLNKGNITAYAKTNTGVCAGGIAGYVGYYGDGKVISCYNWANTITAIGTKRQNDTLIEVGANYIGRIVGFSENTVSRNYSIATTFVNGSITTDNSNNGVINGDDISEVEINEKYNQILEQINS